MTPITVGAALVALLVVTKASVAAAPHTAVYKEKDCGSFRVETVTDVTIPIDMFSQSTHQTIRLINPSQHIDATLDLGQHRSRDRDLGGRFGLDGLAYGWTCVHSKIGLSYLLIYVSCVNEDAKTCSTALGTSHSEWNLIYDDGGRLLITHPGRVTGDDERRLRRLGIWQDFFDANQMSTDDLLY